MKSLVVYYSRTNITKKLAESIANSIDADIEEIIPKVDYSGKMGYVRGGKDAISKNVIDIEATRFNPQDYDVVYLGTPVWASRMSSPLKAYIKQNEGKLPDVKFFITAGGSGFDSALKQLEDFTATPKATLALTTKEVKKDLYADKLADFVKS